MSDEISPDQQTLYDEVACVIETLPQRSVISDSTVDHWIRGIIKRDPERAVWHAHRAAGIGGSEVGELLLTAMGKSNAYNTLEDLSRMKLLQQFPIPPTIHMLRGTAMEPLAQPVYHKLSNHKSLLETPEIKEAFSKPHPDYPFIIGNPDEVAQAGNKVLVTDFKVRSNLDSEDAIKLINAAQVHWYGLLYEGYFKKLPDYYALAELDIPSKLIDDLMAQENPNFQALADNIAAVNGPGFGMQIRTFRHNPAIANNLVKLAREFWENHVLSGIPYQNPQPQKPAELTSNDEKSLNELQNEFLRFKLAGQVAKDKADEIRVEIDNIASKYQVKEWPFEVPGISAGYTERFDAKAAVSALMSKGVDKALLVKPTDVLDTEAAEVTLRNNDLLGEHVFKQGFDTRMIKASLKEAGLSASLFQNKTFRIGMSTKKVDTEIRDQLQDHMTVHISRFMADSKDDKPSLAGKSEDMTEAEDLDLENMSLA